MTERSFPPLLQQLGQLDFDYADGEGYDFEPFPDFLSESETQHWIRAWTGNATVAGNDFLVFGQDGTGGYTAFWSVRPGAPLLEQPIVFLGSEGSRGVVACNFADYLWLIAGGVGPCEAIEQPDREPAPAEIAQDFLRFAEQHAPDARKTREEVLTAAAQEFPGFDSYIHSLCK